LITDVIIPPDTARREESMNAEYDVVVVGGGAGGLAAAREAVRRKARTLLVHEGPLGGDCTHTGCVPSKALIAAAAKGMSFGDAMKRVHAAIAAIERTEDAEQLKKEGIDTRNARAEFVGPRALDVEGARLSPNRVIVATGSGPVVPAIPGLTDLEPLTNENVFDLEALPARCVVLGGGAIGCELAQAFRRLGSQVTIVEGMSRVLAREEPEASEVIATVLTREGVELVLGRQAERVEPNGSGLSLRLEGGGRVVQGDRILVAVGREPASRGFGLERAGVELDERGFIRTDETMRTTAAGVYAVGDVTGKLPFTHAADQMGRVAAANALSRSPLPKKFITDAIPWATFTDPEVAHVGMTETQAAEHGGQVAFLPMTEVDRAVASGETDGFIKIVAGPRKVLRGVGGGQVLGATIVAPPAGEMINEIALAMRTHMLTGRLAQTVHAYPSWSMAIRQAAAQFFWEVGGRHARPARVKT
jgi:pyruvate/2-oxoglutarate dehydrogenase complex dihydrolipoamide dehydrogenase (E3) component